MGTGTIVTVAMILAFSSPRVWGREPLDTGKPQVEMEKRITADAESYAKQIGLPLKYVSYCRTEMNAHTRRPTDGSVPFGVNYRRIKNAEQLQMILTVREDYESAFLTLCLAEAKKALTDVQPH